MKVKGVNSDLKLSHDDMSWFAQWISCLFVSRVAYFPYSGFNPDLVSAMPDELCPYLQKSL